MSDFKFACPECGQKISCDTSYCGAQINCPTCRKSLTVPAAPAAAPAAGPVASPALVPLGQTAAPAQSAAPSSPPPPPPPPPLSARSAGAPPPPPPAGPPAGPAEIARPGPKPSLWEMAQAGQPGKAAPPGKAAQAGGAAPAGPATGYSILGMASLFCSVWVLLGFIPGIICGHLARARMRRNPQLKGREMATAGLAISYAMLGLVLAVGGTFLLMYLQYKPVIVVRESVDDLKALKARIVDEVKPGPASAGGNESEHRLLARGASRNGTFVGKYWRDGYSGGGFSYEMKALPDVAMSVNCRYYGSDTAGRIFDIIVDDQIVGTQELNWNIPGHYFDVEYKVPGSVTKGKSKVTVEIQAHEGMMAGGVFAVETLKR